jgi:hypothetical protein
VITIGIDPHKDTHTAATVEDVTGQLLDELTVPGTDAGHGRLIEWAQELAGEDEWRLPPSALAPGQPQAERHPPRRRPDPGSRPRAGPGLPGEEAR